MTIKYSSNGDHDIVNPIDLNNVLRPEPETDVVERVVHPQTEQREEDSALTKAEKCERHGGLDEFEDSPAKRVKLDMDSEESRLTKSERQKGVAPIKAEYKLLFEDFRESWY